MLQKNQAVFSVMDFLSRAWHEYGMPQYTIHDTRCRHPPCLNYVTFLQEYFGG
jgi:hypothetical protein